MSNIGGIPGVVIIVGSLVPTPFAAFTKHGKEGHAKAESHDYQVPPTRIETAGQDTPLDLSLSSLVAVYTGQTNDIRTGFIAIVAFRLFVQIGFFQLHAVKIKDGPRRVGLCILKALSAGGGWLGGS